MSARRVCFVLSPSVYSNVITTWKMISENPRRSVFLKVAPFSLEVKGVCWKPQTE